ncbi:hypothetical protein AB0D86_28010 [Streptomyces sp. NPDC048324]|uniref:hypothetical protein n=1 Tax=Streptomyces sp. NPDC048324 TaxID=3157205 RepID=UPI0034206F5C
MPNRNGSRRAAPLCGIFASDLQVFRFYEDGTVLDVLVRPAPRPEDAAALARWLRRETPLSGVHTARFEQRGARIAFTTYGHLRPEEIAVRGTWSYGRLTLGLKGVGWKIEPQLFSRLDIARR